MSTKYEPGTVAVATVRGVEGVRVMWRNAEPGYLAGWWAATGQVYGDPAEVTDIRPLVVLDFRGDVDGLVAHLREGYYDDLCDQIEAQTKPRRIPEPGWDGKVEAGATYLDYRCEWVRTADGDWQAADRKTRPWSELIDPTLIREGVES